MKTGQRSSQGDLQAGKGLRNQVFELLSQNKNIGLDPGFDEEIPQKSDHADTLYSGTGFCISRRDMTMWPVTLLTLWNLLLQRRHRNKLLDECLRGKHAVELLVHFSRRKAAQLGGSPGGQCGRTGGTRDTPVEGRKRMRSRGRRGYGKQRMGPPVASFYPGRGYTWSRTVSEGWPQPLPG